VSPLAWPATRVSRVTDDHEALVQIG